MNTTIDADKAYENLLPFGSNDRNVKLIPNTSPKREKLKHQSSSFTTYDENDAVEFGELNEEDEEEDYEEGYDMSDNGKCNWSTSLCCPHANKFSSMAHTSTQKIEPKVVFANERAFLQWLHISVTLTVISSAVLAFSNQDFQYSDLFVIPLLVVSLVTCIYALQILRSRGNRTKPRVPGCWDFPFGVILFGGAFVMILLVTFYLKVVWILRVARNIS